MKEKTCTLRGLCADEAVCFIAERHNVTPQRLLQYFLAGEPSVGAALPGGVSIPLEPNEIEILKGLSAAVKG